MPESSIDSQGPKPPATDADARFWRWQSKERHAATFQTSSTDRPSPTFTSTTSDYVLVELSCGLLDTTLTKKNPAVAGNTTFLASELSGDSVHHATSETSWTASRHMNCVSTPQSFVLQTEAIASAPYSTGSRPVMETSRRQGASNSRTNALQHQSHHWSLYRFDTVEEHESTALSRPSPLATLPSMQYACWQHGCNGRTFTTLSNYRRHCRERSL
jgi:hypothetical protein